MSSGEKFVWTKVKVTSHCEYSIYCTSDDLESISLVILEYEPGEFYWYQSTGIDCGPFSTPEDAMASAERHILNTLVPEVNTIAEQIRAGRIINEEEV